MWWIDMYTPWGLHLHTMYTFVRTTKQNGYICKDLYPHMVATFNVSTYIYT